MRVLLVDNYDSFVFNLAQYVGALGADPVVLRNDAPLEQMIDTSPDAIIISPGPGRPEQAGRSVEVLTSWPRPVPLLGVCLGLQAIGVAFGAKVVRAEQLMHGKTSSIHHDGSGIFDGIEDPFVATRYHSLVIDPASIGAQLVVTATTSDGVIMGARHTHLPIQGVQFHPESVLTSAGLKLVGNFLDGARSRP